MATRGLPVLRLPPPMRVRVILGVMLAMVLAACGGSTGNHTTELPTVKSGATSSTSLAAPSSTTPTTPTTPTTTAAGGGGCLGVAAKALKLAQDARATMRGIRGPTPEEEAELRARGQALLAEAQRLGCRIPAGLPS